MSRIDRSPVDDKSPRYKTRKYATCMWHLSMIVYDRLWSSMDGMNTPQRVAVEGRQIQASSYFGSPFREKADVFLYVVGGVIPGVRPKRGLSD